MQVVLKDIKTVYLIAEGQKILRAVQNAIYMICIEMGQNNDQGTFDFEKYYS